MIADVAAGLKSGVCIGINPTANGYYCHLVEAGASNTNLAREGHTLTYFDSLSVTTDTYPTVYGTRMLRNNAAAVFSPDSSSAEVTGALSAGTAFSVVWY